MDFSRTGAVQCLSNACRALVQWKEEGVLRHVQGPRRSDKQAAQQDLTSIREAATGLGRAEDFAAMPC